MLSKNEIFLCIRKILRDDYGINPMDLVPEAVINVGYSINQSQNLAADIRLDSLAQMEFIMSLETHCGVSVPDEKVDQISTIQDLVDLIFSLQTA